MMKSDCTITLPRSRAAFFFQAEEGIRDYVRCLEFRRVLFRSAAAGRDRLQRDRHPQFLDHVGFRGEGDRKSVVEGKRVDLGGRRVLKKKRTTADSAGCGECMVADVTSTTTNGTPRV